MIRSTFSGLSTALVAVQVNQKRLGIIGQGLANMNTVGYTRRQLETPSLNYSGPVDHYMNGSATVMGFSVSMNKVSQIRDPYLDAQCRAQMSKVSYTGSMQTSPDSLVNILDESSISGINDTLNEIQFILTNGMQDPAKVSNPVHKSELRSRMQASTNLLNDSARQIDTAQKNEFDRLNGEGTNEQGAVQRVNEILCQVDDLNIQVKQNQILGQQGPEPMDERDMLLDKPAGYLPIEVSYYKDAKHSGVYDYPITDADGRSVTDGNGNPVTEKCDHMYEYDSKDKVTGRRDWPDDLRVTLNYTDKNGASKQLTLVEGTEGGKGNNYGSLELTGGSREKPLLAAVTVTTATSADGPSTVVSASESQLRDGFIQASLDILGKIGTGELTVRIATLDDVCGYQFYIKKLDTLAQIFAGIINDINQKGVQGSPQVNNTPYLLLANKTTDTGDGITAANVGISTDRINGSAHVGVLSGGPTDTVFNMLEAMSKAHVGSGNKFFASYMDNTSTILANDSHANQNILKTNVTVLDSIRDYKNLVSGISMDEEASNMMIYISAYSVVSRLMTAMDEALSTLVNSTGLAGRQTNLTGGIAVMRITTMRVTNTTINWNFTRSINDVYDRLIRSMNKMGNGKAYEAAADNPLAYYESKKIDSQYSDVMSKLSFVTDVKSRLCQQELGARSIQKTLSEAKTRVQYIFSGSNNEKMSTVGAVKDDLLQKQQSMINDLNAQCQNLYIHGGNDIPTASFSLSSDDKMLTFSHQFVGEDIPTEMKMTLEKQTGGSYQYEFDRNTLDNMLRAMKEQGRVDVGYGTISNKSTLSDTYTGGLNLLTGLNSDAVNTVSEADALKAIEGRMNKSPARSLGRATAALSDYETGGDKGEFFSTLGDIMDCMTATKHYVTTVYSDSDNKYSLPETTTGKPTSMKQNLTEQYKDKLGADPYEAILDVYNQQYSYSCAQRVSSYLTQSSLFDSTR